MRTTVTLDPDVDELIRRGCTSAACASRAVA
jgi:hypothetical protein